jgi:hypothetical protein
VNSGSFRIDRDLEKGEHISERTLRDIFFHTNKLRVYTLTGCAIARVLQQSLKDRNSNPDEGSGEFLQLSGLKVIVNDYNITAIYTLCSDGSQNPIDMDLSYSVSTTEYVAVDAYKAFFSGARYTELDSEVCTSTVAALKNLSPATFGCILTDEPRWEFH